MKFCLLIAAVCSLLIVKAGQAAEIRLLSSAAVREIAEELLPQFEKSSGHKVTATWSGTALIKKQVGTGTPFDLVIVGAPEIDAFIAAGKMVKGTRADIARSGVGVAIKAGAPRPNIGNADGVKKTLLGATTVAYSTGPSGTYVLRLLGRLGIAEQMKSKMKQTISGRRVGEYIVAGEADLGFQQVSELMHEKGIDFLGPLPPDVQNYTIFSSGIPTGSVAADAARALQAFLMSPAAAHAIKTNGMEPARP